MSNTNYNKEVLEAWKSNASFWDEYMGHEGNKYWQRLQLPALKRLIQVKPDCHALDLATGNGLTSRWLAREGASVIATDGTPEMLEAATRRSSIEEEARITFQQLDVTDAAAFDALQRDQRAAGGFDVVLINMAIMDIPTLEPLANALPKLLKKDGIFVATMLHPVFFTSGPSRNVSLKFNPVSGDTEVTRSMTLTQYLNVPPAKGVCVYGAPAYQMYFHRPIHELFGIFFKAGLVMDALEEPTFTDADRIEERLEATSNYTQLPQILAFRMRRI